MARYVIAKNGVIENIVYADTAPTPGDGEVIVTGDALPVDADIGWIEVDGVWARQQAPITSAVQPPPPETGPTGPTGGPTGATGPTGTEPTGPTGMEPTGPTGTEPTGPTASEPIV